MDFADGGDVGVVDVEGLDEGGFEGGKGGGFGGHGGGCC